MTARIYGRGSSAFWYVMMTLKANRAYAYQSRKFSLCRPHWAIPPSDSPNEVEIPSKKTTVDYLAFINNEQIQNSTDIISDRSVIQEIRALLRTHNCNPQTLLELWGDIISQNSGYSQSVRRKFLHYISNHPSINEEKKPHFIKQFIESISYKFRGSNDHAYYIWALCHMNQVKEALDVWYTFTHATHNTLILRSGAFHTLMLKLIEASEWDAGFHLWRDAVNVYGVEVVRNKLGHEAKSLLRTLLDSVPDIYIWALKYVEEFVVPAPKESEDFVRWIASESVQLLCHADRLADAQKLLNACEKRKWVLRTGAYNKLLTSYLRLNAIQEALELEQNMKNIRLTYNIVTFNLLIRLCGKIGDVPKLQSTFSEIYASNLIPNEWTYVAIMMSFAKTGQVKIVEQLYHQFLNLGYEPDIHIFSALILARATMLDVPGTKKWLAELETYKLQPSKRMYEILAKFFTDSGDVEGAFTCYRAIYQAGLKPSRIVYNALMSLLADRGDSEAAVQIFRMMTDEGLANVGETKCLVTLMDAYGSSQNLDKTLDVFNYIKSVETCKPSCVAWTVLMKAHFTANDSLRARKTFHEAILQGIKPDVAMYTLLMEIENKLAGPERAAEIFAECLEAGVKPDCQLYTALMNIYLSAGFLPDILNLAEEMTAKRISPSFVTLAIVINTLTEIDNAEGTTNAQDYLNSLTAQGNYFDITSKYPPRNALSPDIFVPVVRQATKGRFRSEVFTDAQKVYDLYTERSASSGGQPTKPNIYLLTEMLAASCKSRNVSTASRWWKTVVDTAIEIGSEIDISSKASEIHTKRKPTVNIQSKHILCKPWSYLSNLLATYKNWLEIERTWDEVAEHGFEFDTFNWNERIRYCALSQRNVIWASRMCEEHLIEKWITDQNGRTIHDNVPGYHVGGREKRSFQLREKTLTALKFTFRKMKAGGYVFEGDEQVYGLEALKQIEEQSHRLYKEVENWEGYNL